MKRRPQQDRSIFDCLTEGMRAAGLRDGEIIVDSFAGGGGASLGIHWALGRGPHIAINHDKEAIALHAANHPESEHYPEDVWHVDPVTACAGRPVGLMWLSPDCKHFSKAKGGKPVSKKIRGLAWTAIRWAKAVRPRVIVLENVEEFQTWGPLDRGTMRPDPSRKGQTFKSFVRRLERLGYAVQWRELRACDYGTPTIRKRLFLIARCDGRPIVWPEPTHGKGRAQPWRTAAECIDWEIECPSIFERKKALADNTLRRIARGIQRYVIDSPKPFIVQYHSAKRAGDDRVASVDAPLPTQTVENRFGITVPIIAGVGGRAGRSPERPVDRPYQTITAKGDAAPVVPSLIHFKSDAPGCVAQPVATQTARDCFGLVAAHVMPVTHHDAQRGQSVDEPLATVTGAHRGEQALIARFLKPRYGEDPDPTRRGGLGQAPRVRSLEEPAPAIVPTSNGGDLVAAFLAKHQSERHADEVQAAPLDEPSPTVKTRDSSSVVTAHIAKHYGDRVGSAASEPLHTVTAESVHHALVSSTLLNLHGTSDSHLTGRPLDEPLTTIAAGGMHAAEVRAFLISYYGTDQASGHLNAPTPTVTAKDRLGLVTVAGVEYQIADIGMRMLAPRELYRAQGFPDSYKIDIQYRGKPMTKTAQVRMCGNSVCPPLAAAIVRSNVGRGYETTASHLDEIALEDADRFEWLETEDVA